MEVAKLERGDSFERYISKVRSLYENSTEDGSLPFRVKALMEELFASTDPGETWMAKLIKENKPATELYRDPDFGFLQMGHSHPSGHRNAPHDHGPCWVLYGAYCGLTEITLYERTDDGKEPGRAILGVRGLQRLSAGVVIPYLPGDVHSTQAIETPAIVLRFLSSDLNRVERFRYNLEKQTVTRV